MNPFQFKIPARGKKCHSCSKKFEEGGQIFSTVWGEEEDPQRSDFCKECFNFSEHTNKSWGHWNTKLVQKKVQLTPDQAAMEFFRETYKSEEPDFLLFIAQYLKRKKQLVLRPELKKEGTLFFEDPKSSEVYGIKKREINPKKLGEFQKRFTAALNLTQD